MQGGEKEKTIHPKTKGLERRKKPTQEQSISTIQTKQQHRERGKRCEGGDTQTQTPAPCRQCLPKPPHQTAPASHATAPLRCPSVGPGAGTKQCGPAEADFGEPHSGQLGKTKPSRKMRHEQSQHIPRGMQPSPGRVLLPHSQPLGLPGNQTPPCRHAALLAHVKREQSSCGQSL